MKQLALGYDDCNINGNGTYYRVVLRDPKSNGLVHMQFTGPTALEDAKDWARLLRRTTAYLRENANATDFTVINL